MPTSQPDPVPMPCSVFIPDFQHRFAAAGAPRLPALERLVARAVRSAAPQPGEYLAPRFGLQPRELAPAPFMHLADFREADGAYRLCADFVHLAADRDQLVFMPGSLLDARPDELAALAAAFNSLYGAEGWALELMPRARAYLRCPHPLDVITTEPDAVSGQPVFDHMPTGTDAARLKQLMNESQMLFHDQAANRQREEEGRPSINSLWLWGGGVLPAATPIAGGLRVLGDLPLLRGLALWSGVPESAVLGEGVIAGSTSMDPQAMERDWFSPLLNSLKTGSIGEIELYLGSFGLFRLGPAAARRFWRRPRPLAVVSP